MKPFEVFGVVVRTIGLLLVLGSAPCMFLAILSLSFGGPYNAAWLTLFSFPTLLAGLYLLRGAPLLIWFAYSGDAKAQQISRRSVAPTQHAAELN